MRLLVHTSGRHETLPEAELVAVLAAVGRGWRTEERHARLLIGRVTRRDPERAAQHSFRAALARLGMSHSVARAAFVAPRDAEALAAAARQVPLKGEASFAVRAEYADPTDPRAGPGRSETARTLGGAWQHAAPIDLESPARTVCAWIAGERVWVGPQVWTRDRAAFQDRAPGARPFFSPVSSEAAIYRAVANLTRVPPGGLLYDPLAGTGGLLLEAALAGTRAVGSDLDPGMVQGARTNLEHYGAEGAILFVADVREAPERFLLATGRRHADGVVTDLPYGQSATTAGVPPQEIARWTFRSAAQLLPAGARLAMGAADPAWFATHAEYGFAQTDVFPLRVHKSLTRTYSVFVRQGTAGGQAPPSDLVAR